MPQQQSYDNAYKLLFSHPEMVKNLMLGFFHEEWVQYLDFDTLERFNSTYTTEDLRERENDIIWKVRFKDQWLYLYLLIEAQSTVDPFMAVRLVTYMGLLYLDIIKEGAFTQKKKQLPPILPIVLYNGQRNWRAPLTLHELLDPNIPKNLKKYQPNLHYWLLDERRCSIEDDIIKSSNVVAPLIALEQSETETDAMNRVHQLTQLLKHPKHDSLKRAYLVYLIRIFKRQGVLSPQTELNEFHEGEQMLAERVDAWSKRLRKEGREEGIEEGIEKGRIQIAKKLYEQGMNPVKIAEITGLELEHIYEVEE